MYENIKLSDYDNLESFMTAMINAAHQSNKEISNTSSHIKNRDIAMQIIHDLPPALFSLQTILLKNAPPPSQQRLESPDPSTMHHHH